MRPPRSPLLSLAQLSSGGVSVDTLESLRDILNKTESGLRVKAEAVLRSVEENRINTLPAMTTTAPPRYHGDFHLASVVVQPENAIVPREPNGGGMGGLGSPSRRQQATLAHQAAYMRRPVGERMAETRAMELMSRPTEATYGGVARDFIQTKFGLERNSPISAASPASPSASASISVSGTRPIERYGRNWRDMKLARGSRASATVLPKAYRRDPRLFPPISSADASRAGVLGLVERGFIPSFVDVSSAFTSMPAPLQQAPSTFHHHADQFKRGGGGGAAGSGGPQQIAMHAFNLSQVRLDLGEVILDRHLLDDYDRDRERAALAEEKQAQALLTAPHSQAAIAAEGGPLLHNTTFNFPALMPADSERAAALEHALTLHGRQDIDDLLAGGRDIEVDEETAALDAAVSAAVADRGPRDYDELLDTYSLHQFLIRKGKTLSSTPEFQSFARTHHHAWGQVRHVLRELERLCKAHRISVATVRGARVVQLAEDELARLSTEALFSCFVLDAGSPTDPILRALLGAPSQARYSMGGDAARTLAAITIQAAWRMFAQRRLYLSYRFRHAKAILIQRAWRRFQTILRTRATIAARWSARLDKWRSIQSSWRKGFSSSFSKRKRVLVHVPSLSTEPYQRQGFFNFAVRENAQLSRLCDAADPDVDVLYITPFALTSDVQSYYLKLLEVGGASTSRVKVLVPENASRFPEHFSLAKQALYSPKLLRKIREHLRGRPACIVPGEVGVEDLQLAVELGLPLWAPEPEVSGLFGSKSGSKRIFAAAEVHVAPGAHDIYDEVDLYSYLAKLMVDHLHVARWFLKIDNESGGRGVACLDTAHFRVIASLRAEKVQHSSRWTLPEVLANAQERVVVALKKSLARKAVLACPHLYDGRWSNFAAAFFRVGGVIEAAPPQVIGSPSVNMLIAPDGDVRLLSSHDQVFSSAFVFAGANFPSSAPADLIHAPALAVGRQCFREGILGYVGVDFVAWSEGPGSAPKVWAVDLNLRLTPTQSSFMLFDFLLKGRYVYSNSGTVAKDTPVHLRPAARYLVPSVAAPAANGANNPPSTPQRSASRSGLTSSSTASPSARMFGSGSASASREHSRPTSGQNTPKLPGIDGGSRRSASMSGTINGREELRYYSTVPYLYQPHLATVQFGSFFNLCRLKGVSFDVRARLGTVFMMMDSLASGTIGLLCVGLAAPPVTPTSAPVPASLPPSPLHAMQLLVDALAFLNEQVSNLRFGTHLYDAESNLLPLLAAYKGLVKAQREANQMMRLEQNAQLADLTADHTD